MKQLPCYFGRRFGRTAIVAGLACALVGGSLFVSSDLTHADEGMWLFNQPPRKLLQERYGFEVTDAWLTHLQKASIRFNSGGSGSFVSAEGLVMTASIQQTGIAFLGMDLNIEGPVFANDTLYVEVEVIEARRTSKRPDRALVRTRNTVKKQDGKTVMVYTPLRMMKCRTAG